MGGKGVGGKRAGGSGRLGFSSSSLDPNLPSHQYIFPTLLPHLPPPTHTHFPHYIHPPSHTISHFSYSSNAEDPEDPMAGGVHHFLPTSHFTLHTNISTLHTSPHSSNAEDPEDPMAGGVHHSARGACRPLRLPPGLPSGLYRLTSLGLLVSEPHDLQVWGGGRGRGRGRGSVGRCGYACGEGKERCLGRCWGGGGGEGREVWTGMDMLNWNASAWANKCQMCGSCCGAARPDLAFIWLGQATSSHLLISICRISACRNPACCISVCLHACSSIHTYPYPTFLPRHSYR